MKTAAGLPRRRLNGQEGGARERERGRDDEDVAVRVDGRGGDREEPARDQAHARRQSVHVVEQVERVRHPDEPDDSQHPRERVVVDDLHRDAAREDECRGDHLQPELGERVQRPEVVDEARDEEDRAAGEDRRDLVGRRDAAEDERGADGGGEAGEDADAPECRGGGGVPPVGAGRRAEQGRDSRRLQQRADHQERDRQRQERRGDAHREEG